MSFEGKNNQAGDPVSAGSESEMVRPEQGIFLNRSFMLLWLATGASAIGGGMAVWAASRQGVVDVPDVNFAVAGAMILFTLMLPSFVLGPISGLLADRFSRRGLMIVANLGVAVVVLGMGARLGVTAEWERYGPYIPLVFIGVLFSLFASAWFALMPTVVRSDQLVRANALTTGLVAALLLFTCRLCGWLAEYDAANVIPYVSVAMTVLSAALLLFMRLPSRTFRRQQQGSVTEAVRYVLSHRRVRQLSLAAVVVWWSMAVVFAALPAIVMSVYQRTDFAHVFYFHALMGWAVIFSSSMLAWFGSALRGGTALTWSFFGLSGAIVLLAVSVLLPLGDGVGYALGLLAVVVGGMFTAAIFINYRSLLQQVVPHRLQGRVHGLLDMATIAGVLFATAMLGILQWHHIDAWVGWLVLAVGIVVVVIDILVFRRRLRTGPFEPDERFWWRVNSFYTRFWFRFKCEGICTIPPEGPVIVIANHTAPIDPLLIVAASPHRVVGFLVAEEFSDVPIGRYITRMIGCIPVRRDGQDAAATREAMRRLKNGGILGIFIEGRIAEPGEVVEPKDGPAMMALRTGATVVPAFISGTVYTYDVKPSFFIRHRARIRFGKPIDLSAYSGRKADKADIAEVSQLFMRKIRELGNNPSD